MTYLVVSRKYSTDLIFGDGKVDFANVKGTTREITQTLVLAVIFPLALLLASPSKAYGYVDPGSGSFIYQAIYAAFIGGVFYLRKFLTRIFKRNK
jgi:hypothetical protein